MGKKYTWVTLHCPICGKDWQAETANPKAFETDNECVCDKCVVPAVEYLKDKLQALI